jgi:nicotinate-nucleotide adenylyltransferase
MVKHAISSRPGFILSTVEIERPGPHYALDTVEILSEQNPGRELAYIMGSDSLCDLPTWHRSLDLVSALGFIGVMRRPGDSIELSTLEAVLPGLTAKVRFIDSPPLQITSHEIRRLAAEGRPFRHLVLPAVYNYIIKNRLYRA